MTHFDDRIACWQNHFRRCLNEYVEKEIEKKFFEYHLKHFKKKFCCGEQQVSRIQYTINYTVFFLWVLAWYTKRNNRKWSCYSMRQLTCFKMFFLLLYFVLLLLLLQWWEKLPEEKKKSFLLTSYAKRFSLFVLSFVLFDVFTFLPLLIFGSLLFRISECQYTFCIHIFIYYISHGICSLSFYTIG